MVRRKIPLVLLCLLACLQFLRPAKNSGVIENADYIGKRHPVPAEVRAVLAKACFDCHSDRTRYPWYAEVQPVGWWLAYHVNEGRERLNFSAFGAYSAKRQVRMLDAIADEIFDRRMPLKSYTWIHRDAILNPAEIKLLTDWADTAREGIAGD